LVALRDGIGAQDFNMGEQLIAADKAAYDVLKELGYAELQSIPSRVAALNEQLKAAMDAGDGATIAALGKELERAKRGAPPLRAKVEKKAAVSA
jgi:hypothetical protein